MVMLIGLIAGSILFGWFVRLQATGRDQTILAVLFAVVIVEALMNSSVFRVQEGGIFRPVIAGQDFRPPDLVLVVAMGAAVVSTTWAPRFTSVVTSWGLFALWYTAATVAGVMYGFPFSESLYQGKAAFYLFGGAIVAARVDVPRLVADPRLVRWQAVVAFAGAGFVLTTLLGLFTPVDLPGVKIEELGRLSDDAITILVGLGLTFLLVSACGARRSVAVTAACCVLVAAPFAANQRGSFVGLAGSLVVVVVGLLGREGRQRIRVSGVDAAVFGAAILLVGLVGLVAGGSAGEVVTRFDDTFFAEGESRTASVRVDAWKQSIDAWQERPFFGQGNGLRLAVDSGEASGRATEELVITAHNVLIDVGSRSGLIGVGLLLGACWLTGRAVARVWRRHPDDAVAALTLGAGSMIAGIMAKGMVESVFEKFRFAVIIGVCIGLIAAAHRSLVADETVDSRLDAVSR